MLAWQWVDEPVGWHSSVGVSETSSTRRRSKARQMMGADRLYGPVIVRSILIGQEWCRSRDDMEWTGEKPTRPGWYWHQSGEHDMRVVELYEDGTIGMRQGGLVISLTANQFESRYGRGRWYGPIAWESLAD